MTTNDPNQSIREIVRRVADERHISFDEALRLMLDVASELLKREEKKDAD